MNLKKLNVESQAIIDEWIQEFNGYTYEQLIQKPAVDSWSLGQVGIHLWMSAKGFFFKNAERCLTGEKVQRGKSKNPVGWLVYVFGQMPAIRIKMPKSVAVEPQQPDSKEQLIRKLEEVKQLTSAYIARIPQSDPALKTRHPFLGWLNTAEWVRLCALHFEHHAAQKRRIKQHFGWK